MPAPEFSLYCEVDGQCVLKYEGEAIPCRFTDVLHAMEYMMAQIDGGAATLTVYDPLGRVSFRHVL